MRTKKEIEHEVKAIKKDLFQMVIEASKKCTCVGSEIMPNVKRVIELRRQWIKAKK